MKYLQTAGHIVLTALCGIPPERNSFQYCHIFEFHSNSIDSCPSITVNTRDRINVKDNDKKTVGVAFPHDIMVLLSLVIFQIPSPPTHACVLKIITNPINTTMIKYFYGSYSFFFFPKEILHPFNLFFFIIPSPILSFYLSETY